MLADRADDGVRFPRVFDHAPEGGGHGVAIALLKQLGVCDAGTALQAFFPKPVPDEQERTGSVVCFRFHFVVGAWCGGEVVVAQQHVVMSGEQIVANLMGFEPTMLWLRNRIINEDVPAVREVKGPQVEFPDRVEKEHGACEDLFTSTLEFADDGLEEEIGRAHV